MPPVDTGLTVQVKDVEPEAVPEDAVTVTLEEPVADGVPEIRPEELIDSPAGSPVAEYVRALPAESVAGICNEAAAPPAAGAVPGVVAGTVRDAAGGGGAGGGGGTQGESSEFSWALNGLRDTWFVQPPAGFWSDSVSCHSWPSVML